MNYFVPVVVILGYAGAVYLSYVVGRLLITQLCGPVYLGHLSQNFAGLLGCAGLLVGLAPGLIWGTQFGRNYGGELGELMFGANGIVVGTSAGIILVTVAVTSLGALAGAVVGKSLKTTMNRRSPD